jgi:hypothetical protein
MNKYKEGCLSVAVALALFALWLVVKPPSPALITFNFTKWDDGWFDSTYSNDMQRSRHAIDDWWTIGDRRYATRDLMGRRI